MRGKAHPFSLHFTSRRITPAYAGKRVTRGVADLWNKDHPRLCGEKAFKVPERSTKVGSPPPMRGKVWIYDDLEIVRRITPAYAGKSSPLTLPYYHPPDHPRLCGEKAVKERLLKISGGSPPPMRGKVYHGYGKEQGQRITPAYAGKSKRSSQRHF